MIQCNDILIQGDKRRCEIRGNRSGNGTSFSPRSSVSPVNDHYTITPYLPVTLLTKPRSTLSHPRS